MLAQLSHDVPLPGWGMWAVEGQGGGLRCPASAQPQRFAIELLPPSLSLLLFPSLPFPAYLFLSLFFFPVLLCTTESPPGEEMGKGVVRMVVTLKDLGGAFMQITSQGSENNPGYEAVQEQRIRSNIIPSFSQKETNTQRSEDLPQVSVTLICVPLSISLLLLALPYFP